MRTRRGLVTETVLFTLALAGFLFGYAHRIVSPPPFEPIPKPEGSLRIVTWNLGGGMQLGGSACQDAWLPAILASLNELDADLVLLQELADNRQLSRIRRELDGFWRDGITRGLGNRRVGILVRDARIETDSLPELGHRGLLARVSMAGVTLAVGAVHADAFSAEERNELLGRALEVVNAEAADYRILGGDFNLDLDLDKRRDLFSDDAYLDVETYNHVAGSLVDAARGRGATAEPDRRLDYLFVDGRFELGATGVWKGRRIEAMDHDPVVADVRLP